MRHRKIIAFTLIIAGLAIASYTIINLHNRVDQMSRQLDEVQTTLSTPELTPSQEHVVIFLVKSTPTDFYLVPVNRQTSGPANPTVALQALLNGPLNHEGLFESVPHSTKLLGLSIYRGLATANFSKEIIQDFNGGSLMESYLVQAIVNTLTEFSEVDRVQILVEGEKVDSLGGHILITEPLRRD